MGSKDRFGHRRCCGSGRCRYDATLKAAEETPMITVYEANVTDVGGYKNQFLTALQPKIDKAKSAGWRAGKLSRRTGQVLRVWEGGPAASAYRRNLVQVAIVARSLPVRTSLSFQTKP